MCGIVGYLGSKHQPKEVIINGLKKLEYRGYDSAGIAVDIITGTSTAGSVELLSLLPPPTGCLMSITSGFCPLPKASTLSPTIT